MSFTSDGNVEQLEMKWATLMAESEEELLDEGEKGE